MRKEKGGKRGRKKMDEREKESQVEERSEVITEEGSERREEECEDLKLKISMKTFLLQINFKAMNKKNW